jgi:predicted dehydrogenase
MGERPAQGQQVAVGIAGLGRAGWGIHAQAAGALGEQFRVAAVCDADPRRQDEAHARFGCRAYGDYQALLRDDEVEVVVVAVPSHLHAEVAIAALRAGKDVLIEKPFATSLADADRIIAAAEETGRLVTGSQNQRYAGDFLKVREVVESGKLGTILQIRIAWHWFRRRWDWQTLRELGGGSLNNDGSHAIDQALLLFGAAQPEVVCRMVRTPLSSGDAEDHVKVILHAPDAPLIDLEFSNAVAYPQEVSLVMGTQGGLAGSHSQLRWRYVEPALLPRRPISRESTPDRSYNREDLPWVEETCDLSRETHDMSVHRLYHDLYATLRQGAPLAITPASVRRQIAVLEECRAAGVLDYA